MSESRTSNFKSHASRLQLVVGQSISTILFRRSRVWIAIACAMFLVLFVGWWANRSVENAVTSNIASQLETLLNADLAALRVLIKS